MRLNHIQAVMFDLDGTLIDSAPDLAGAVNYLRSKKGLDILPVEKLRPYASQGVRGLIYAGLGIETNDPEFESLKEQFLDYYEAHSCVHTCFFSGVEKALADLDMRHIPWGIVTNKHMRFTLPIVKYLSLDTRAAVIVAGDTTAHAKPHPVPMLYAAEQIKTKPQHVMYLGDDERDIQAARAAQYGAAVATAYGYCQREEVTDWQADFILQQSNELFNFMQGIGQTQRF